MKRPLRRVRNILLAVVLIFAASFAGADFQLLHELGHLFGAVDDPPGSPGFTAESIYSYKYADRTDRIDPANHNRIMRNKHRLLWSDWPAGPRGS